MSDRGEQSYAQSIAARGGGDPERRAELSEALFGSGERLADSVIDLREALVLPLEAQPEHSNDPLPRDALQRMRSALADYESAACAATTFLMTEGHTYGADSDALAAEAAWHAVKEVDEESLADAASAVREGTMSRDRFMLERSRLTAARARFDDALDAAVLGKEVGADA